MSNEANSTLTLAPYVKLARELTDLLVPVPPRPDFVAGLYTDLLERAHKRQTGGLPVVELEPTAGIPVRVARWIMNVPTQDRRWMWGAAAVGSAVSLAGLATLVWRRRSKAA
ncbi:MAG: hypothetical protein N2439_02585 [Anaerolineae bacterium]|nr:hypothetical protein [Anaerolineae bacterium]